MDIGNVSKEEFDELVKFAYESADKAFQDNDADSVIEALLIVEAVEFLRVENNM